MEIGKSVQFSFNEKITTSMYYRMRCLVNESVWFYIKDSVRDIIGDPINELILNIKNWRLWY